jgi:hypothetical protein
VLPKSDRAYKKRAIFAKVSIYHQDVCKIVSEKKTLKTGDNTPKSNIQLRKRLIPKITKLALLKYAKSSENYCEVLYLE